METIRDQIEERQLVQEYMRPRRPSEGRQEMTYGYVVKDAPWSQQYGQQQQPKKQAEYQANVDSASDFPSLGSKSSTSGKKVWGPWGGQ